jgi:hypothetical protein
VSREHPSVYRRTMTVETTAPRGALGWYPINTILNHRILTFPSLDYTKTIKVLIGPEEQIFIIHTDIVCAKSRFLKAACSDRWKEGQEECVRLPDVKPETCQCYVDWVYGGIFVAEGPGDSAVNMSARLYVLGDTLDDVKLRITALKALTSYACVDHIPYPPEYRFNLPGLEQYSTTLPLQEMDRRRDLLSIET